MEFPPGLDGCQGKDVASMGLLEIWQALELAIFKVYAHVNKHSDPLAGPSGKIGKPGKLSVKVEVHLPDVIFQRWLPGFQVWLC